MATEDYKSDIEIARAAEMRPIIALAEETLGLAAAQLEPYGHYKAKVSLEVLAQRQDVADGKLILVTAMTPTPAGEGKTTTTVGLGDALSRLGKRAMICLREPSLGPCFGMKGGAAGGGYAQVVPMEDINLHFTGDFHAIGAAHNLLSAMVDNHVYWGNGLDIDTRRITWRRVVDMNDRALRSITVAQGGVANGFTHEGGYDITVASEVMAILCLAEGLDDLRAEVEAVSARLGRRIKFLVGKPGLDGHSNGAEQIAVRARDCGIDVVYQGIRMAPAQIVDAALAEDAHVIGLSILSGSHMELIGEIMERMHAAGLDDVPVVAGGIIPVRRSHLRDVKKGRCQRGANLMC